MAARPLPATTVPDVPTTGAVEVWQLTAAGDAVECVETVDDSEAAARVLQKVCTRAAIAVREGITLRTRGGVTAPQLKLLQRRVEAARRAREGFAPVAPVTSAPARTCGLCHEDAPDHHPDCAHATPANDTAPTETTVKKTEKTETNDTTPTDACEAKDCGAEIGQVRSTTPVEFERLCPGHRRAARCLLRDHDLTPAAAVRRLREEVRPAYSGLRSTTTKAVRRPAKARAAKAPTKPKAVRRAKTPPPADGGPLPRLTAVLARLGGLPGAERLADRLDALGGVAALDALVTELGGASCA